MFFGGGGRTRDPNAPQQGDDLQYTMILDFEEAIFGKETDIEVSQEEECDTCHGSGAKPGTKAETCSHCHGSGQLNQEQNTPFGRVVNRRVCHYCNGTGKIIPEKCETCGGSGTVNKKKKFILIFRQVLTKGSKSVSPEKESREKMADLQAICLL